jgi:hypothetical protein
MAGEWLLVDDDDHPVDERHDADNWKHEQRCETGAARAAALRPLPPAQQNGSSEVGRGNEEQRHPVEPESLVGL